MSRATSSFQRSWTATFPHARGHLATTTLSPSLARPLSMARRSSSSVSRRRRRGRRPAATTSSRGDAACQRVARSVRSSSALAWGRNEKIPPPWLSATTNTHVPPASQPVDESRHVVQHREVADESTPRSPEDTPSAVETTPSMPLTPRFATTRARRAGAHHSTSRTGIDDPTTSDTPASLPRRDNGPCNKRLLQLAVVCVDAPRANAQLRGGASPQRDVVAVRPPMTRGRRSVRRRRSHSRVDRDRRRNRRRSARSCEPSTHAVARQGPLTRALPRAEQLHRGARDSRTHQSEAAGQNTQRPFERSRRRGRPNASDAPSSIISGVAPRPTMHSTDSPERSSAVSALPPR